MVALLVSCSSGPAGLGKKACPYLRPRLVRLDRALVDASAPNITAVDQDLGLYLKSNLPDGAKAKSDQPLVAFSAALHQFAIGAGSAADLAAREAAVNKLCGVAS